MDEVQQDLERLEVTEWVWRGYRIVIIGEQLRWQPKLLQSCEGTEEEECLLYING